ncbi:hypothetical protein G6F50_018277 [Rhizopus delemar]|uniref:Uncharacterized protein n=1 Tax=Rhizopus delemar TaxID=936053 RepID=A0A9P6XMX9_9FUNG|nr:hypothetical protein G6F50_018277 [Rhizopus delemar]
MAVDFRLGNAGQPRDERRHGRPRANHLCIFAGQHAGRFDPDSRELQDFARGGGQAGGCQVGHDERAA